MKTSTATAAAAVVAAAAAEITLMGVQIIREGYRGSRGGGRDNLLGGQIFRGGWG